MQYPKKRSFRQEKKSLLEHYQQISLRKFPRTEGHEFPGSKGLLNIYDNRQKETPTKAYHPKISKPYRQKKLILHVSILKKKTGYIKTKNQNVIRFLNSNTGSQKTMEQDFQNSQRKLFPASSPKPYET